MHGAQHYQILSFSEMVEQMQAGWIHDLPHSARCTACIFLILATAAYCFLVLRTLHRSSSLKALAAAPVICVNLFLPFLFSIEKEEIFERALTCGMAVWLGNLRLIAFLFHRGQLFDVASSRNPSLSSFIIAMYFPIRVTKRQPAKAEHQGEKRSTQKPQDSSFEPAHQPMLSRLLPEALVKVVSLYLGVLAYDYTTSQAIVLFLNSAILFLLLSLSLDLVAIAVAVLSPSLLILPHFEPPFLAASLQDFWARRWNLTMSNSLREAVYEPLVDFLSAKMACRIDNVDHAAQPLHSSVNGVSGGNGQASDRSRGPSAGENGAPSKAAAALNPAAPSKGPHGDFLPSPLAARLAGLLASFVASAVIHEAIYFFLAHHVTGDMLLFFSLHGCLTAAEVTARHALKARLGRAPSLPWPLNTAAVLCVVYATGDRWFIGPFMRAGLVLPTVNEVRRTYGLTRLASLGRT